MVKKHKRKCKQNSISLKGLKDTHREKAPSNKTLALTTSTKMGI